MRLRGKAAIVTGGAKGIGLGIARVFAREGADVALMDLDQEAGAGAADKLRAATGQKVVFVHADVSKPGDVRCAVDTAIRGFGRLDVLVNNAGTHNSKGLEDCSEEDWDFILNTNLRSAFLFTRCALPELKKTRGCVINIASMAGIVGQKDAVAYVASKGGMIAMTKAIALDVAECGVRVNAICPGFIRTPLLERWLADQPDPVATQRQLERTHPLGRLGESEEVGLAALYLATEDASFVTGAALPIEGGLTLGY